MENNGNRSVVNEMDLEAEYILVKSKKSKRSAAQRKLIVEVWERRIEEEERLAMIETPEEIEANS